MYWICAFKEHFRLFGTFTWSKVVCLEMHPKDTEALKTWLTVKLQPLCDADPLALAKYVFALIRKDKPTDALRELCIDQLEVFLGRETLNFVSELFHVLENGVPDMKKELKVSADLGSDTEENSDNKQEKNGDKGKVNPPLNKSVSEEIKYSELDDDDRDFKRARKEEDTDAKPAISPITFPSANSAGLLKRKRAIEENRNFPRKSSRIRPPPLLPDAVQYTPTSTQPTAASGTVNAIEKKQRCKDYDEKGFCLLGENCPYDHGADPLVVEGGGFPPPPLNLPSTFLPPMPPQYFMVPPPPSLLPPAVNVTPATTTETDTTGYNPEQPALSLTTAITTTPLITITTHTSYTPTINTPAISNQSETERRYHLNRSPTRMNRYQGGGYRHQRAPQEPTNTLVLRKVPPELNVLSKLNGHFEKFGKIVNLKVGFQNDPEAALVQFTTVEEAKAAHNSSSAVLGNRFIRVYYMRVPKHQSFTPNTMSVNSICEPDKTNNSVSEVTSNTSVSEGTSPETSKASELPNGRTEVPSGDVTVTKQPEQHANKQTLSSPSTPPARHKGMPPELIKKQKEVHLKMKTLLDDQLKQQKALIAKLDSSGKMLTAEEKKKVMDMVKTLSTNITKLKGQILHQQAQFRAPLKALETPPANPPTEKPTVPPQVRKVPDLRNKLRKKTREIVVCKVTPELKEQLTDAFEKLGGLVQVRYDPANTSDVIFTFRTQVDAKRAVDNGSVFNDKPLIMKWYYQKEESPANHTVHKERKVSLSAAELQSPAATDNPTLLAEVIEIPDDDEEEEEERSWKR